DRALVAFAGCAPAGLFRRRRRKARRSADLSRARIRRSTRALGPRVALTGASSARLRQRQDRRDRFLELVEPGRAHGLADFDDLALAPVAVGVGKRIDD